MPAASYTLEGAERSVATPKENDRNKDDTVGPLMQVPTDDVFE